MSKRHHPGGHHGARRKQPRPSTDDGVVGTSIHSQPVVDLSWNCNGTLLGSTSRDKNTKICQLNERDNSLKLIHTIPSELSVVKIVFHPSNPSQFAIAGEGPRVDIWEVRASKPKMRLTTLGSNINMAWSPNGEYIAVATSSDKLMVLNLSTGTTSKKMAFSYEINELKWSKNSDHLLIASAAPGNDGGNINIVSYDSSKDELDVAMSVEAHNSNGFALDIDRQFYSMAVGSADHLVSIWELSDLTCLYTVDYDAQVRCLSFSGDGNYFVAAVDGKKVQVRETHAKGAIKHEIESDAAISIVRWNPMKPILAMATTSKINQKENMKIVSLDKAI